MSKKFIGAHISPEVYDKIEAEKTISKRSLSAEIYTLLEEALECREKERAAKA